MRQSSYTSNEHWGRDHRFEHWYRDNTVYFITSRCRDHTLGYLKLGSQLGPMMRKFHGSVAKLVNDTLPERHLPFWRTSGHQDYFDGCIRDAKQCRRAYRYTLLQSVRARLCKDWRDYPNTRVAIELERGLRRAIDLNTFLPTVPYKRYER